MKSMEKKILGVELSNGKNAVMERKALEGITLCPEGATVLLIARDLQRYTGTFEGISEESDGEKVMLKSLTSTQRIGLPVEGIAEWYQEVDGGAKPYEQSEGFDAIDTEEEQPYGKKE